MRTLHPTSARCSALTVTLTLQLARALHQDGALPTSSPRYHPAVLGPDDISRPCPCLLCDACAELTHSALFLSSLPPPRDFFALYTGVSALQYYSPQIFANLGFTAEETLRWQSYNSIVSHTRVCTLHSNRR